MTLLVVTHDARVAQHATRIVEMGDGQVTQDHAVEDRLEAAQVLAAMPRPEPEAAEMETP